MPERVVVVEDDGDLRTFLGEVLEDAGYETSAYSTADDALRNLNGDARADLVVTDLIMPGLRGHELLAELRKRRPELNVIIITAFGSIDSAIEMVKAGAYDYLTKPFSTDDFLLSVERALGDSRLRREIAVLSRQPANAPPGFIAASRPMQELLRVLARA